jgi:hypothetical protein
MKVAGIVDMVDSGVPDQRMAIVLPQGSHCGQIALDA